MREKDINTLAITVGIVVFIVTFLLQELFTR